MKIFTVGAKLFHAYGQTDMTKLMVVFRNFAKAPKNCIANFRGFRNTPIAPYSGVPLSVVQFRATYYYKFALQSFSYTIFGRLSGYPTKSTSAPAALTEHITDFSIFFFVSRLPLTPTRNYV